MIPEINEMRDGLKYVEDALYVFGGKWKLQILIAIYAGAKRFRDLKKSIPKITSRVLSKELKSLEANKLIARTIVSQAPMSIEYSLTAYANTLEPVLTGVVLWGMNHRKKIMEEQ